MTGDGWRILFTGFDKILHCREICKPQASPSDRISFWIFHKSRQPSDQITSPWIKELVSRAHGRQGLVGRRTGRLRGRSGCRHHEKIGTSLRRVPAGRETTRGGGGRQTRRQGAIGTSLRRVPARQGDEEAGREDEGIPVPAYAVYRASERAGAGILAPAYAVCHGGG